MPERHDRKTPTLNRLYNRKQYHLRSELGLCRSCGVDSEERRPAEGKALCEPCRSRRNTYRAKDPEYHNKKQQEYKQRLKDAAFNAYGGYVCVCCKETHKEFLTIDHVKGGGGEHRRKVGVGPVFHRWLRNNHYPEGFRVLCMNCNFSHGVYGYCPHRRPPMGMNKFAVDESVDQETLEKRAAQGCPMCGGAIEKHGHVLTCPKHGSEPFEKAAWPQGNPQRKPQPK